MENKLPAGWELRKLSSFTTIVMGQSPLSKTYNDTKQGLPFFQGKKEFGKLHPVPVKWCSSPLRIAEKGDILMSVRAPVGSLNIANEKCCIGRGLCAIRVRDLVDQNYLWFYLRLKEKDFSFEGRGTTFDSVSKDDVYSYEVPIPFPYDTEKSLRAQKQIVARLDQFFKEYDILKEEKIKAKENYEKILQSAIWKFIQDNEVEYLKLGEVCEINPSKREMTPIPDSTVVSFIPMASVSEISGSIEQIHTRTLKEVNKGYTYFREGDIIFAKITPCMENGKMAITKNLTNKIGFGSTEFHVLRCSERVLPEYVYHFLRQKTFRSQARMNMTGTAGQLRVPSSFLEEYSFPVPHIDVQRKIVKMLESIRITESEIRLESETMLEQTNKLPHSVLTKAFAGELV